MTFPWLVQTLDELTQRFDDQRLPHALLFTGQTGVGKQHLAEALAGRILCETMSQCGQCKGCQLLKAGSHPDFKLVGLEEDAQQIKIEQIRYLIDWVNQTAQMNGAKVSIIFPAHKMNRNSANALLKVMEEPPAGNHLILISDDPALLLPTIRSRAQTIMVPIPDQAMSLEWLKGKGDTREDWDTLLALSHGSPLLALARADDEYLSQRQSIAALWLDLWQRNKGVVQLAADVAKLDLVEVLVVGIDMLSDIARLHASRSEKSILNKDIADQIVALGSILNSQQALKFLTRVERDYRLARGTQNPNKTLLLEALLIDCLKVNESPVTL